MNADFLLTKPAVEPLGRKSTGACGCEGRMLFGQLSPMMP